MLDDIVEKTIVSPRGQEQKLYIYAKPITQEEMYITVSGLENLEAIKAENKEKYEKSGVDIPKWNAGTLHVKGRDASNVDLRNLELIVSSALHSQAIRNHKTVEDEMPVTVIGVVETSDGYIIMGIRRGSVQGEQSCVMPLGYADHDRHPVEMFKDEGIEEVGIPKNMYSEVVVMGYQTDPDFTNGLNIVHYAKSTLTRDEILRNYSEGLVIWKAGQQEALRDRKSAHNSRKAGHAAVENYNKANGTHYPVDAGDHDPMFMMEKKDIDSIIYHKGLGREEGGEVKKYQIMGNSLGALVMYADCVKRGV